MKTDDFGERMKLYEGMEAKRIVMPLVPVCVRVDGRCFHSFTRGFERPYDETLRDMMTETTIFLVEQTNACIGYTQSDEISLVLYSERLKSQLFFDGRIQKLTSVIASLATAKFLTLVAERVPAKVAALPTFDCRVWTVPNLVEAANYILWREADATKNSISMAADFYCGHTACHSKKSDEKQEMLWQKGINWNDYPAAFKREVFVQKRKVSRGFTPTELLDLPEKHEARSNPDFIVERSIIEVVSIPPFRTVTNRVDVVFNGADPIVDQEGQED